MTMVQQTVTGVCSWLLWSQTTPPSRYDEMGGRFREGGANFATWQVVLLILIGLLLAVGVWWVARRLQRRDRGYSSPRQLFLELCKLHKIQNPQRQLLWSLARKRKLTHPGRMFVEPNLLEQLPPDFQPHADELQQLRQRLFPTAST